MIDTAEQFVEYKIKQHGWKSFVLVGNGMIKGKGKEIDSFDCVARINKGDPNGYEKDVGTKTDLHFFILSDKIYESYSHMTGQPLFPFIKGYTINPDNKPKNILFAGRELNKEFIEPWDINWDKRRDTTGFMSALLLLSFPEVETLHLVGFDGMTTGHFFDPKHKHFHKHTSVVKLEFQWLKNHPRIKFL